MITIEQARQLKKGQHLLAFYKGPIYKGYSCKGRWVDCLLNDIRIGLQKAYVYLYPNEEEDTVTSHYGGHTLVDFADIILPDKALLD